jgi:hypothetical protein
MAELSRRIRSGERTDHIGNWLDGLSPAERWDEVRSLNSRDQADLFERAEGRPSRLDRDFVPAGTPPMKEVIHRGINSLPLFRNFEKRFCLPSRPRDQNVAWGYNEQTFKPFTGPGYFVAREDDPDSGPRTVVIDYCAPLPEEKPTGWPDIIPNSARLSRFIYFGTRDWMWRVSNHVTIGRARRDSGWMDNWFLLCRD